MLRRNSSTKANLHGSEIMKSMLVDDLEDTEGIVLCFGLHTIARQDYWFLDCATALFLLIGDLADM